MNKNTVDLTTFIKQYLHFLPQQPRAIWGLLQILFLKPHKCNSMGLQLEKIVKKYPEKTAILYRDRQLTYDEVNREANRLVHSLQQRGVGSGDAVAVMMDNRPETLIALFGIVKLGAIAGMINTSQRRTTLLHSLNLVNAKQIIVGEEHLDAIREVETELPGELKENILVWRDCDNAQSEKKAWAEENDIDSILKGAIDSNPVTTLTVTLGQPCFYIFTSGTTGLPKASIMTHLRWMKGISGIGIASMNMTSEDVFYVPLPFYHNNALTVSLSSVLSSGATMAIGRKFSASRFWDDIRFYNATCFSYIGELLRYVMMTAPKPSDSDHNIRMIIGNGLRPDLWHQFKDRFQIPHINEFYGASECNLFFSNMWNIDNTAGFCPLPFEVVKYDVEEDQPIRNADGLMEPVERGDVGLLVTKVTARIPFDGYTDKSSNNKKLFSNVKTVGDCYFNSGDLVVYQGYGHIAFADRLGDTFRWKGENVSTTEVEAIINQQPLVKHSVAYSVAVPNTDGRAGMVALTLSDELDKFDLDEFTKSLQDSLPSYAVPLFMRVQTEHKMTSTFKPIKGNLKKEGFSLDKVSDPMFFLPPKTACFHPLEKEQLEKIEAGEYSF